MEMFKHVSVVLQKFGPESGFKIFVRGAVSFSQVSDQNLDPETDSSHSSEFSNLEHDCKQSGAEIMRMECQWNQTSEKQTA